MSTYGLTPQPATIIRNERLVPDTARLVIRPRYPENFHDIMPGQYVMLWVPHAAGRPSDGSESDMLPFSVAGREGDDLTLLVRAAGNTTRELISYREGDDVGVSGPRGNGFNLPSGGPVMCVAGGVGVAPMLFLRQRLAEIGLASLVLFGAKSGAELLGLESEPGFHCATEDGSFGHAGTVTDMLAGTWDDGVDGQRYTSLFCCGPEGMMRKVLDFAIERDIEALFSLERHFYCASGVCGFCEVGGRRTCVDGPVFTAAQLAGVSDFGLRRRDASGVYRRL